MHTVEETSEEQQTFLSLENLTNQNRRDFANLFRPAVDAKPLVVVDDEHQFGVPSGQLSASTRPYQSSYDPEVSLGFPGSGNYEYGGNSSSTGSLRRQGRRRDKSRQYIYATLTRTHATPGGAKTNRGISLLSEKIAQSRLNARQVLLNSL